MTKIAFRGNGYKKSEYGSQPDIAKEGIVKYNLCTNTKSNVFKVAILIVSSVLFSSCGGLDPIKKNLVSTDVQFSSVSPTSGVVAGGELVSISGANFEAGTAVTFGSLPCTSVTIISAVNLTCITPASPAGSVTIVLTNPDNSSFTAQDVFSYGTTPVSFTSVTPDNFINTQSTSITVTGTGFVSGMTVTIGGAMCTSVAVNSASELTCMTPTGSGSGAFDLVVTNPSSVSATGTSAFEFRTPPTLTVLKGSGAQGAFQTCLGCHGGTAGLTISDYTSLMARVMPGDPSNSLIWIRMNLDSSSSLSMPRNMAQRPESERQALTDWILDGAQNN